MNWYEVLEVSPSASPQVIRAAYKSLMQRYHPDKGPANADPADAQRATHLAQAYAVLSDTSRRQAYDQQLRQQRAVPASPAARATQPQRPVQAASAEQPRIPRVGWLGVWALVLLGGVVFKTVVWPPTPHAPAGATTTPQPTAATRGIPSRRIHLPVLVVAIQAHSPALAGEAHHLTVPSVVLELGPWQAEQATSLLGKPSSTDALQAALAASLSYEALIAPDGPSALTHALQEAANTILGPPTQPPPRSSSGDEWPYGVQSVVLPQAFTVR